MSQTSNFRDYPMRVGRKLKRTLYVADGDSPDADTFVGVVDTPELAAEIMTAVNAYYGHEEATD